jgi:phage shock protein E
MRILICILAVVIVTQFFTTATAKADDKPAVKKINLDEFEKMRAEKENVVLDVRTPKEFDAGHVPGAVNIDWHARDFNERVSKLDKSKTYLVHCQAGVRSAAASKRMAELKFEHLFDFTGGWSAYSKADKPVEKGKKE